MIDVLALVLALSTADPAVPAAPPAGTAAAAQAPRGSTAAAVDVGNDLIQSIVQRTEDAAVSDQQLRIVDIEHQYNIGIGVVHRAPYKPGQNTGNAIEHSEITEIYHVIRGSGTLVTGGTMANAKPSASDSAVVKVLNGPSLQGGAIAGGVSKKIGPGDVVVIPPNTAHWFSEIDAEIVYLVVRVDPHRVLPAGYRNPLEK